MDDPDLKRILVKKALDAGVRVENRTMAVGLLKEGTAVAGAIGVNVRTAEMISCSAKAVILAAGGTARFGLPPSGHLYGTYDYPGNTGDGYLLGFRAGAPLTSMECTMCYCLLKDVETPGMAMMIQKGGSLLDAMGRAVMENEFYNLSDVNKLQNSPVGPLRLKLRHLPEERIEEIENLVFSCERPITQRFLKDRGLDVRRDDLELATSEIFLCGGHGLAGLVIDANGATSVPGLYGAGDTAPLPRGYLTGAFVFGELAAENACQFATGRGTPVVDETSIARAVTRVERFSSLDRGTVPITHFEYKVRRYINEYLTPPKNEYRLLQLRHLLEVLKKDLSEVVRIRTERDLFLALEVENIIDSAFMSTVASLERKESRWGFWHQRGDFPERDDTRWKRHLDLVQNPGSDFPHIRWRDVERIKTLGGIE